ncbi:MAG: ATP-binding protein [Syntrophomonadaceae bacterium]|jgi:signal transduction histidine kinase
MKSIRIKLWAGMMALVMVVLILLWLFQIVFLESFYTQMRIADIREKAISITKNLDQGSEDFRDRLDALAYENNMSIDFINLAGNTTYTTGNTGMGGQMPMMRNETRHKVYRQVLSGQEVSVTLSHPRFGNKYILMGLPVYTGEKLSGVLLLNLPLAPVADTAAILKKQLFYISLALLAAALLISFLLARSFSRPIIDITRAAEKMAAGDFSARINIEQRDEIGNLAKTVNYLGQQLAQIEQLRKDLIANVSHELRTPLSLIRGYAETLRDVTGNEPEKRSRQLGIIIDESERLSKIVDDILNLSQLQSGHFQLNKTRFRINDVVHRVTKRYALLSEKTGVDVVVEPSGDAILEADESRIEQVLYNLINNAFNHTPQGGTITITTRTSADTVRVEVSDTGSGIAAQDIPHIWDRFYKSKNQTDFSHGTGLGLAVVKAVLKAHGAGFGVESQPHVLTTFWFEFKPSAL